MTRVIHRNGRAALVVLAGSLVGVGIAAADEPAAADVRLPASVAAAVPAEPLPAAAADERPRDRLLELVVEYLDFAFVRETKDTRTAQLDAPVSNAQ